MEVDGSFNYTGFSPGKFETLDLQLPLFIGGHSNQPYIHNIHSINEYKSGFKGIIIDLDGHRHAIKVNFNHFCYRLYKSTSYRFEGYRFEKGRHQR